MKDNPIGLLKDAIKSYLSTIEDEEFRFAILLKLNDEQVFLLNIYQSGKGFLEEFKGLQLRVSKSFRDILKENDRYESTGSIETDYPFLYGKFIEDSSVYIEKIYVEYQEVGLCEFLIKKEYIPTDVKDVLESLIQSIKPFLIDLYIEISEDIERRYFAVNSLNITKNMRPRTFYHSFRVADLAVAIADKIGLSKNSIRKLNYAALIHDIGEMYISNDIFYKQGSYTEEEVEILKQHPYFLKVIFARNPLMEDIVNIAYYHHERIDGGGYFGIKGDELPVESKILALCETIDGLYTDRPDRKGFDIRRIISIVRKLRGKAFDRRIAEASLEVLEKYYIKRDFEFSKINHLSNIGKPIVVEFEKGESIKLVQGVIEYITPTVVGIAFYQPINEAIEIGKTVRVQLFFFDLMFNFKGSVISSTKDYVNIFIKDTGESVFGSLHVFGNLTLLLYRLSLLWIRI
ncbi:HD-GYP domain-containing protein [Hippea maritima]|uniref:Metal dependent phosphohydrolase n=1 Tax=Hippea maritima (strain ATCC 700847 / DSM 10411 / MH2) TaxID=760142 RepID=F2LXA0_HIPMA|nr:HD domain-containing phosphohydrolase [Hippea maritima]AEA34214.1 metal dependent phosphohydrolase [Hippea maritima DSM 10411]